MPASDTEISKFMSYVLRHAPQELNLALSEDGWTDYATFSHKLCEKLGKGPHVLLKVDAGAMSAQGISFFRADNGVWLAETIPPDYLSAVTETHS